MVTVTLDIKESFFDRPKVQKRVDKMNLKQIRNAAALQRRNQRRLIKVRAATKRQFENLSHPDPKVRARAISQARKKQAARSRPGDPPFAHTRGKRSIRFILFGMTDKKTAICGAVRFPGSRNNVPETLEHGGIMRFIRFIKGVRRVIVARIAKRPSAQLALRITSKKMPNLFKDAF